MTAPATPCLGGCGRPQARDSLCDECWNALAAACLGKRRFYRMRHAEKAIKTIQQQRNYGGGVAYPCLVCGSPHLSGSPPNGRVLKRIETIVTNIRRAGSGWVLTRLAGRFEGEDRKAWKQARIAELRERGEGR